MIALAVINASEYAVVSAHVSQAVRTAKIELQLIQQNVLPAEHALMLVNIMQENLMMIQRDFSRI